MLLNMSKRNITTGMDSNGCGDIGYIPSIEDLIEIVSYVHFV